MRKNFRMPVMLAITLLCLAGAASAAQTLTFSPAFLNLAKGETATVALVLNEAPNGLSGYEVTLVIPSNIATVTDATFPSWAALNRKTPGSGTYTLSAVDLNKQVQSGLTNIVLATVTIRAIGGGTATVGINNLKMNADGGDEISPSVSSLQVTVSGDAVATTTTTATATATTTETTTATATATTAPTAAATPAATTSVTTATTTSPVVVATAGMLPGAPLAGFTATPSAGNAPLKVRFYDRSTGSPTSYEWDFGDGGSSMIQNPTYTYYNEGLYTVSLKVSSNKGSTSVSQKAFIAVGEKYIAMQPTPTPVPTIPGLDLPAPTMERTNAPATAGIPQRTTATTTAAAAANTLIPVVGILAAVLISVLVITRK